MTPTLDDLEILAWRVIGFDQASAVNMARWKNGSAVISPGFAIWPKTAADTVGTGG